MNPEVRVQLALSDIRLEYQGTQAFYDRLIDPLVVLAYARSAGEPRVLPAAEAAEAAPEPATASEPAPEVDQGFRPTSPHFGQFIQQVGPRASTADQQAMAFGFFLWNYERMDAFGAEELEGCFRTVGLETPDDLGALLDVLREKRRFLEPADETDRFQLTSKGRNYVKNRLLSAASV